MMRSAVRYGLTLGVISTSSFLFMWSVVQQGQRPVCLLPDRRAMAFTDTAEPHLSDLLNGSQSAVFQNALVAGRMKPERGFLTLGIPTVKRPKNAGYLIQTIEDLLKNANDAEKREITLIIFLADIDATARNEIKAEVVRKFGAQIDEGLIQLIQAPREFYPSFDHLPKTYKHTEGKVKWRSKQNFDYAYLMLYAKDLSQYYLQLEDDLTTIPNYIGVIKDFIHKSERKKWTCLEFSALGFIAKLYRSQDLEKLAKMMMLFYYEQPNDFTYIMFNQMKLQEHRIVRKPTIFKHLGLHSSLAEKTETRADPLFEDVSNITRNTSISTVLNPPAKLATSLKIYNKHKLEDCYSNKGIMWTYAPQKGMWLTVVFEKPQRLASVVVQSGPDDHPDDFLKNAVFQIGQSTALLPNRRIECTDIFALKRFKYGQINIDLDEESQSLEAACVQVMVTATQPNWLMVSEISIRAVVT